MLEWRQVQAILELLTGRARAPAPPDALDEPWRTHHGHCLPTVAGAAMRPQDHG